MKLFKITVLLCSATLISCGPHNKSSEPQSIYKQINPVSGVAVSPSIYELSSEEGSWSTGCDATSETTSNQLVISFSVGRIKSVLTTYSDNHCEHKIMKKRADGSYKIGKNLPAISKDTYEFDSVFISAYVVFYDQAAAEEANKKTYFGFNDWSVNEKIFIPVEKIYAGAQEDKVFYSIIAVTDAGLSMAAKGSGDQKTPETRPNQLDSETIPKLLEI